MNVRMYLTCLAVCSVACTQLHAGFVAHWRFEEGTAGTTASGANSILDSTSNNLHMSPRGNPTYTGVAGAGSATGMLFDGAGDLLDRADSNSFQLQSLTVEAFVRYDGTGGSLQQIFFRGDLRGGIDPIYLAVLNGKLRFNISDLTADRALDTTALLPVGELIHVAATLDHATDLMKIFVNGTEVASRSAGGMRPNVALRSDARISIGGLSDGFNLGQHFNGVIDEVRIADTALNPSQFLYSPVPEPSSLFTFSLVAGLVLLRRKARRC